MRRFASVFPFVEQGGRTRAIGRLVANHDFVRALLRHGTFDEYLFSNPSPTNLRAFEAIVGQWGPPARVTCVNYPGLKAALEHAPPDVMYLGGWGAFMPGLHSLRSRLTAGRWPIVGMVFSLHGRDVVDHAVRLNRAQLRESDAIFCLSHDGREAMRRLLDATAPVVGRRFRGRLLPLPLGVDDDVLAEVGDRVRGRGRLRIAAGDVVLLVLGRMTPSQKMDLGPLLVAFARTLLPAARVPLTLVIAGGASPADLALVKDTVGRLGIDARVRLHPNFALDHRADLLAAADVLVSPVDNTQETFGLSLLEAQGAGLPVVASRFDGYKDLVRDGVDGFLVDTYWSVSDPFDEWFDLGEPHVAQLLQAQGVAVDLDQLSARVLQLAHDPALRERMGRAGREKVAAEFAWRVVIPRYEAVWDELARAARAEPDAAPEDNPFDVAAAPHFSHYASRLLTGADEVQATGLPLIEGAYADVAPWLPAEAIARVLAAVERPTSLAAIAAGVALAPAEVSYIVRWLVKYGVLRVVPRRQ